MKEKDVSEARAKKASAIINEVKQSFNTPFSFLEFKVALIAAKFPYARYLCIKDFIVSNIVKKLPNGYYTFVSVEPIHYSLLRKMIDNRLKQIYSEKPVKEEQPLTEKLAVELLKSLGYKIMKPMTEYVEI